MRKLSLTGAESERSLESMTDYVMESSQIHTFGGRRSASCWAPIHLQQVGGKGPNLKANVLSPIRENGMTLGLLVLGDYGLMMNYLA